MKESIHDSMYESSKTLIKQLDKIGDKLANVVEDFPKETALQETVEVKTEIDPMVEAETIQETTTGTEVEIGETTETTKEAGV